MKSNSELPDRCKKCPRGAFNDFWCVWAETKCYKDSVAIDAYMANNKTRSNKG